MALVADHPIMEGFYRRDSLTIDMMAGMAVVKNELGKGDSDGSLFSLVLINNHFLILFLAVL